MLDAALPALGEKRKGLACFWSYREVELNRRARHVSSSHTMLDPGLSKAVRGLTKARLVCLVEDLCRAVPT